MKITRILSVIAAAALMLEPLSAFSAEKQKPVFPQFNKNEVNGLLTVKLPEGTSADISITFTSPEGIDFPYYSGNFKGGSDYSFDIEGRDNSETDYRYYTLSVLLKSSENGTAAKAFTETFNNGSENTLTIKDVNDNPDSFAEYTYEFTCDDKENADAWEITKTAAASKTVAFHISGYMLGDVTGDGVIDSRDASNVLISYAKASANQPDGLTDAQKKAADVTANGKIDAVDASMILAYYAQTSAGLKISLADFVAQK